MKRKLSYSLEDNTNSPQNFASTSSCNSIAQLTDNNISKFISKPRNSSKFAGFTTASGKIQHISEDLLEKVSHRLAFEDSTAQPSELFSTPNEPSCAFTTIVDKPEKISTETLRSLTTSGFSTASGKPTHISDEALNAAKQLIDVTNDEGFDQIFPLKSASVINHQLKLPTIPPNNIGKPINSTFAVPSLILNESTAKQHELKDASKLSLSYQGKESRDPTDQDFNAIDATPTSFISLSHKLNENLDINCIRVQVARIYPTIFVETNGSKQTCRDEKSERKKIAEHQANIQQKVVKLREEYYKKEVKKFVLVNANKTGLRMDDSVDQLFKMVDRQSTQVLIDAANFDWSTNAIRDLDNVDELDNMMHLRPSFMEAQMSIAQKKLFIEHRRQKKQEKANSIQRHLNDNVQNRIFRETRAMRRAVTSYLRVRVLDASNKTGRFKEQHCLLTFTNPDQDLIDTIVEGVTLIVTHVELRPNSKHYAPAKNEKLFLFTKPESQVLKEYRCQQTLSNNYKRVLTSLHMMRSMNNIELQPLFIEFDFVAIIIGIRIASGRHGSQYIFYLADDNYNLVVLKQVDELSRQIKYDVGTVLYIQNARLIEKSPTSSLLQLETTTLTHITTRPVEQAARLEIMRLKNNVKPGEFMQRAREALNQAAALKRKESDLDDTLILSEEDEIIESACTRKSQLPEALPIKSGFGAFSGRLQ